MSTKVKSRKALRTKANLEKFAKLVDKKLEKLFEKEIDNSFGVSAKEKSISKHIIKHIAEHNLRPAKRVRAFFIYLGYKLLGGSGRNDILNTALSIELVHTGLLMFDDFMDEDNTRRGKPTTHQYYKNIHKQRSYVGSSLHYGEGVAVNAGLAVICMGYEILGKCKFNDGKKLKALNRLFRGITNTSLGQAFDLTLEAEHQAREKDIVNLHHAKTAIYTYENPLHIGAILAGANEKDLMLISKYAIPGGIGFQLQDDILGLFGNTKKTGKPAHSDLRQGKMTLLIVGALEKGNPSQRKRLNQIWRKSNLTDKEAQVAREIVIQTGSLDYSKNLAVKWSRKAQEAIPVMKKRGWNKKAVYNLDGLAQYMIERDH